MVKALIGSPVVIADLTSRNPNVYYELGIAHSFGKKTIIICESAESLAFDARDERAITLGMHIQSLPSRPRRVLPT